MNDLSAETARRPAFDRPVRAAAVDSAKAPVRAPQARPAGELGTTMDRTEQRARETMIGMAERLQSLLQRFRLMAGRIDDLERRGAELDAKIGEAESSIGVYEATAEQLLGPG